MPSDHDLAGARTLSIWRTMTILKPAGSTASITLRPGDSGLVNFGGGTYQVSWNLGDCTSYRIEIAPTNGATPVKVTVVGATGSQIVKVPAGPAYVNRSGVCPGPKGPVVTINAHA